MRASIFDEPVHTSQNVLLYRLAHRAMLIVGKDDHIFPFIAKVLDEIGRHVPNIANASPKLPALTKVVDAY